MEFLFRDWHPGFTESLMFLTRVERDSVRIKAISPLPTPSIGRGSEAAATFSFLAAFIFGAFLFRPASKDFAAAWDDAGAELVATCF